MLTEMRKLLGTFGVTDKKYVAHTPGPGIGAYRFRRGQESSTLSSVTNACL